MHTESGEFAFAVFSTLILGYTFQMIANLNECIYRFQARFFTFLILLCEYLLLIVQFVDFLVINKGLYL